MAYRRRRRSRRYFRKKKFGGRRRRTYRRKKLSTKRFKQFWPDCLYAKYKHSETGIYEMTNYGTNPPSTMFDKFVMSNPRSNFGPNDQYAGATQTEGQIYHTWDLVPAFNYRTIPSAPNVPLTRIAQHTHTRVTPNSADHSDILVDFPDMKTTALRYTSYRIMGTKITMTFRCTDNDNGTNPGSWPYFITGLPFQSSFSTLGNYWQGTSSTTQNGITSNMSFTEVQNTPHGFIRKVKGQGAKNGGTKTISFMLYPWKIMGLTRQQWMNDPLAVNVIGQSNGTHYKPNFVVGLSDYNPDNQRTYVIDYTYTVFVRWEGQKFLQDDQA